MSVASRFYRRESSFTSFDDDNADADATDKYLDGEELELDDVLYSSSRDVDRSSIGSIPWADDAIKKNQLDWEAIERMLRGGEEGAAALPVNEPELQNEIAEWQRKFPQLMDNDATAQKQQQEQEKKEVESAAFPDNSRTTTGRILQNDSLDIHSISNLSLNSLEEEEDDDEGGVDEELNGRSLNTRLSRKLDANDDFGHNPLGTVTTPTKHQQFHFHRLASLSLLSNNLRIRSVPLTLRHRRQVQLAPFANDDNNEEDDEDDNSSAASTPVPPTPPPRHPPKSLLIASPTAHFPPTPPLPNDRSGQTARRMRMPPILNVLETTRRFRGLTNSHRSFVQLTQIDRQQQQQQQQQAKSAAIRIQGARKFNTHSSAWHAPIAAAKVSSSFLNQRNAIILPAINRHTARHLTATTTTTTETTSENGGISGSRNPSRSFYNSSSSSPSSRTHNYLLPQHQQQQRQRNNYNGIAAATTSTSTAGTPSSNTGRSISAAVHHQHNPHRMEFNAFYLPYSAASKFKAFK